MYDAAFPNYTTYDFQLEQVTIIILHVHGNHALYMIVPAAAGVQLDR